MRGHCANIYRLGVKELISLRYDVVLVVLIVYFFTYAVYAPARGTQMDLINASIAVVDEDGSPLSRRIQDALLPPYFLPPVAITVQQIDAAMDGGSYTFVIDIPPRFQADLVSGRSPTIQINVDATAMIQAGSGANHLHNVIQQELAGFLHSSNVPAVRVVSRSKFNPNRESPWFVAVMQVINNITLLAIFLTGAALIREREHGTIEHLLVMPLGPAEIMLAKIWANGLVVVVAASLSLPDGAGRVASADHRLDAALRPRRSHLPLRGDLTGDFSRHPGPLHAAVCAAGDAAVHRHEPALGQQHAV